MDIADQVIAIKATVESIDAKLPLNFSGLVADVGAKVTSLEAKLDTLASQPEVVGIMTGTNTVAAPVADNTTVLAAIADLAAVVADIRSQLSTTPAAAPVAAGDTAAAAAAGVGGQISTDPQP